MKDSDLIIQAVKKIALTDTATLLITSKVMDAVDELTGEVSENDKFALVYNATEDVLLVTSYENEIRVYRLPNCERYISFMRNPVTNGVSIQDSRTKSYMMSTEAIAAHSKLKTLFGL